MKRSLPPTMADIGLIGLAVMGENLILNLESKGFTVACYNRTTSKVDSFMEGRAKGKKIQGAKTPEEFCKMLAKPRKVMIMVKAGFPVDATIKSLLPFLEKGDIIVDGGNSNYEDTNRRIGELEPQGFNFFGAGVSGGEEGALKGPSIMPGGSKAAWEHLKPILQAISAKVEDGSPCCDYIGPAGSGHFVKMVHNGIEYGDMQVLCEAYYLMKSIGMTNEEMADTFDEWNKGELDSYLIEITRDILRKKDDEGKYVVDYILDRAGQKGTGKWTVISGLELGAPVTLIAEATMARTLSSYKAEREEASKILQGPENVIAPTDRKAFLSDLHDAIYASKISSYAQGFFLLKAAAKEYNWDLNYGAVALMWRGGCIIRSKFLGDIKAAFEKNHDLTNLLLDDYFHERVQKAQAGWRRIASQALLNGHPLPSMTSALCYYDGLRTARLPANLLQGQRDYFGAHTYERTDKPGHFHTNWTGRGGSTASSTYNA
eukprot:TRINITY_DN5248_c0_g1_i1.p1 TRINITY_DN5248_c0_g1~~TRINITY_DN5248_c0_g1_i1.p1  ORF type:complete len:488 (+),score=140.29 TRINITY_DN5248_c0_g1_i1:7-1470(+)